MSASLPLHRLVEFDGRVDCLLSDGTVNLTLCGRERAGGSVEALLVGASAAGGLRLPHRLHQVRLLERPSDSGPRLLHLESRELQLDLAARALQLHRAAGKPFFEAVPSPRVPFARRVGWALLLSGLRIPGAVGLLTALRGER
jgi:hypothetical protein